MAPPKKVASYDPFYHVFSAPYFLLRPPRFRLKTPSISFPSPMVVFVLVLVTYFLVISGVVYDVISEPPGMGSKQDPTTGAWFPQVFLEGRLNGQYIIEGLASGFMITLGGIGLIILDLACDKTKQRNVRLILAFSSICMIFISYCMSMLFLRIKVHGYLS